MKNPMAKCASFFISMCIHIFLFVSVASAQTRSVPPIELGSVAWGRDYQAGLQQSLESQKPILLLFQEVPGCAGCQDFGRDVLSQPLLVEAIAEAFVPVAIFNNQPGEDARVLKRFSEPAWNYQVIRYLDAGGNDLIPRKDRIWTRQGTVERMVQALEKAKRPIPKSLQLLQLQHSAKKHKSVLFAQSCFWVGEAKFGGQAGVVATEAGFYQGREVTRVTFDPAVLSLKQLAAVGQKMDCARALYLDPVFQKETGETHLAGLPVQGFDAAAYRKASARDQKVHLQRRPELHKLGLTSYQTTKINALLAARAPEGTVRQELTTGQRAKLVK